MLSLLLLTQLAVANLTPKTTEQPVEETTQVEEKVEELKQDQTTQVEAGVETSKEETSKEETVEIEETVEAGVETSKEETVVETSKEETVDTEEVPKDFNEAAETVSLLVTAVQDKNWTLVIGLLLTLVVFVANKFGLKDKVGGKYVPVVAVLLGTMTTTGLALVSGIAVTSAITQGIVAGMVSIGGWEVLFKHFLASKKEA